MSREPDTAGTLRLTLARATAWALLLAGWVGLGGVALSLTPNLLAVYALVATWLLALGLAATVATRDTLGARSRRLGLALCALLTALALLGATHGGGLPALLLAACGWAGMTALASGVVRSARLAQAAAPSPPVGAASLGALCAAVVIADPGDAAALSIRLAALMLVAALALSLLQVADRDGGSASRCRAGLFDCSLPAWPAGAWHDPPQWPALLAGLAMLPMMAALPVMVAWCRVEAIAPQAMIALHFAAMFGPALLLRRQIAGGSARQIGFGCALLLTVGGGVVLWAPTPLDLLGVAMAHGAAWSLAWSGQLWSPSRRGRQGSSPLRAAVGYAGLTLAFGWVIEQRGPVGLTWVHALLGLAALLAWACAPAFRSDATAH